MIYKLDFKDLSNVKIIFVFLYTNRLCTMLTSLYKAKSPEILALKYNFNNGTIITDSYNDVIKESKVWTKFRTSVSVGFSSRIHTQTNKNILKESMEQARQNNLNYIKSCIKENYPAKLR